MLDAAGSAPSDPDDRADPVNRADPAPGPAPQTGWGSGTWGDNSHRLPVVSLAARASFASHRLIGWIYWDPGAIARYAALGIPNGAGYYIGSRAAPLAPAGNSAVAAAFYSINPVFVGFALDFARQHTTFDAIFEARNEAVGEGLRAYVPEICDELASMGARPVGRSRRPRRVGPRALRSASRCAPSDRSVGLGVGWR